MPLIAIRHGQASFGSVDYDRLSETGVEQSRRLGRWLAAHSSQPDAIHVGAMRRHTETLDGIRAAYAERELAVPEAVIDPALNEFDHSAVFGAFMRRNPAHPAVAGTAGGTRGSPREIFALLHAALVAWTQDDLGEGVETWVSFRERIDGARARLQQDAGQGDVLLVSSGGVVSQLAQVALDASDVRAIELNLSLRNSAVSEFHALSGDLRLGSWNALPHLAEARELWTYY
jgi:broad specificity phosphatase PhoE